MSTILCMIFGHKPPQYASCKGWGGYEYCDLGHPYKDGIGREHVSVHGQCARCGEKFKVGMAHLPMRFHVEEHLKNQQQWSQHTFGPGMRTQGVVDHIRKELLEIESAPDDLEEWIDVIILAFDGAWRAGYGAAEVIAAWRAKQTRNENREWPDWRTADTTKPIEHVRSTEA